MLELTPEKVYHWTCIAMESPVGQFWMVVKVSGNGMKKEQFIERLNGNLNVGGTFNFFTERYEGFIFWMKGSKRLVSWVDDKGFSSSENSSDAKPKNIGEFQSIEEMLETFKVDGTLFAKEVLPNVEKLNQIYA